jgi:hypothetical protein
LCALAGKVYLKDQIPLQKPVQSSINPKVSNPQKRKRKKFVTKMTTPQSKKRKQSAQVFPLSSLTPTKQVSQLMNQNSQMIRTIIPQTLKPLGVAKANAHSILTWLQNLQNQQIMTPRHFEETVANFSKIQNSYFEDNKSPQIFYEKLSTATAYGDIEKVENILRDELYDF